MPFPSASQRAKHYVKHGHEFGAANEFVYEQMADAFMSLPANLHLNLVECSRTTGTFDRIRLDGTTGYYGVAYNVLTIRTFHLKDIAVIARTGGALAYVLRKCAEVR